MSNQAQCMAAAAAAGAMIGAYYVYKSYSRVTLPTEWTEVGTLKDIYVYPIKSCAPIMMEKAECSILGLKDGWLRDRILMVVDENNKFITARGYPELYLIQPTVRNSILTLKHRDMEPVHVNLAEVIALQKPETAEVWGVQVPVYSCGWEVSEWLSRLLDRGTTSFKLVYYASQSSRQLRKNTNKVFKFTKNDTSAVADEVPFNLINLASVDDLNTRMEDYQVSPRNFRPNFVLQGSAKAYDEDNWKFVKIGDNIFEIIKPCTRCVMTTIDPETGVRNSKPEPLQTLKSYRQIEDPAVRRSAGESPRMGLQMALRTAPGGHVTLNDTIYVSYK